MNTYITIDGWNAKIRFSSAHVIPEYEKCGRLHGHTYEVHAKVFGKTDEKGLRHIKGCIFEYKSNLY